MRARGEATRERALAAALRVYARATRPNAPPEDRFGIHAVIAESQISLGSLYHHFGSMDGLSAALYARSMAALLDALLDALDGVRSARRGTRAIVVAYLAFAEREPARARFIHASAYADFLPAHAALVAEAKGPRLERIAAFYRQHVRAGRVVALPETLLEMLLIGPVAEFTRRWLAGAPGFDLDEARRLLPERIWRSLRAPAQPPLAV